MPLTATSNIKLYYIISELEHVAFTEKPVPEAVVDARLVKTVESGNITEVDQKESIKETESKEEL